MKKIHSLRAKLIHTDGQKDTTKLIVSFRNSVKVPRNEISCKVHRLLSVVNSKSMKYSIRAVTKGGKNAYNVLDGYQKCAQGFIDIRIYEGKGVLKGILKK